MDHSLRKFTLFGKIFPTHSVHVLAAALVKYCSKRLLSIDKRVKIRCYYAGEVVRCFRRGIVHIIFSN